MRKLEAASLLTATSTLLQPWHTWRRLDFFVSLLALAITLHLFLEHPRWQLGPLYAVVTYLFLTFAFYGGLPPVNFILLCGLLLCIGLSGALSWLFPIPTFPPLYGPFQSVGHRFVYFDTTRATEIRESVGRAKPSENGIYPIDTFPSLGVHVWYPSSLTHEIDSEGRHNHPHCEHAQFISNHVARGLASFLSLPAFMFSYLPLGRTRAIQDAPLFQHVSASSSSSSPSPSAATSDTDTDSDSSGGSDSDSDSASSSSDVRFPVILLSHGLGGVAQVYSMLASELASHGYVVFAPSHNDGSACAAEQPDGSLVPFQSIPIDNPTPESVAKRQAQLSSRVEEMRFVLDNIIHAEQTGSWPSSLPFGGAGGRLDLSRVSVVGHSFGGCTAVTTAARDERIKAVVAHDFWTEPAPKDVKYNGLKVPVLVTLSEEWQGYSDTMENVNRFIRASTNGSWVAFSGTRHSNFCDVPVFSPWLSRRLGAIGDSSFESAMERINRAQVTFLNVHMQPQRLHPEERNMFREGKVTLPGMSVLYSKQDELERH